MGKGQVLEIITVDGSRAGVLRRKAKPAGKVTLAVQRLIEDMVATLRAANGLGLAAPQVGEGKRVLVAEVAERLVTLVDPVLAHAEGEEVATEACLSIPGVLGPARRGGGGGGRGGEAGGAGGAGGGCGWWQCARSRAAPPAGGAASARRGWRYSPANAACR